MIVREGAIDADDAAIRAVLKAISDAWQTGPPGAIAADIRPHLALDDPQIDISADVAVATLTWRMRYEYEGAETAEAGVDTHVLSRRGGRWLVLWRRLETDAV